MGEPAPTDIVDVRATVDAVAHRTPILPSRGISDRLGSPVCLKAENLQRTGAFKIRGAAAKLASLGTAAKAGLVAASAGNHAQALALAARGLGLRAEVYMPTNAAIGKVEACRAYGGIVHDGGESVETAVIAARRRADEAGLEFCHPYDDAAVIAGQGTIGLEITEQVADLTQLVVPLGGGGLLAGIALAVRDASPSVRIVGVQAAVCAPYVTGTAPEGPVATLADGIAVKSPGVLTRPIIERLVDDIVQVDEAAIADSMMVLAERSKMFVEGGGAVGVAAILSGAIAPDPRGATCVVLSGGNVDLGLLPGLIRRQETALGRRLLVFIRIPDRPGALAAITRLVADGGANVVEVAHVREGLTLGVRESGLSLTLEVKGPDHARTILRSLGAAGYDAIESKDR